MLYQKINDTSGFNGSATIINIMEGFFLLTAEHVSKQMKVDANVVFRTSGDKPAVVELSSLTKKNKTVWLNHPIADLSIIELSIVDKNVYQRLKDFSFPSTQIYSGKDLPQKESDITF